MIDMTFNINLKNSVGPGFHSNTSEKPAMRSTAWLARKQSIY